MLFMVSIRERERADIFCEQNNLLCRTNGIIRRYDHRHGAITKAKDPKADSECHLLASCSCHLCGGFVISALE